MVSVEVGDLPMEAVKSYITGLKAKFEEAGIKDILFTATKDGKGVLTFETIKEEPKGKKGK